MQGFLSQGQIAAAKCVFAEISEKGLSPTLASYHGLLNFHVNAADRGNAWKVIGDMQGKPFLKVDGHGICHGSRSRHPLQ